MAKALHRRRIRLAAATATVGAAALAAELAVAAPASAAHGNPASAAHSTAVQATSASPAAYNHPPIKHVTTRRIPT